jgi:hypothetical protein
MSSRNLLTRDQAINLIQVLRSYYPGTSPSEGQAELWGEGLSTFTFEECVAGLRAFSFEESRYPSLADLRKYAKAQKPVVYNPGNYAQIENVRQTDPGKEWNEMYNRLSKDGRRKDVGPTQAGDGFNKTIDNIQEETKQGEGK